MKLAPLLVYMTCLAASAPAQTGLKEGAPPPKFELAVHPEDIRDGLPFIFTVTLRNVTDHELRFPNPSHKCITSDGGIMLSMTYTPPGPPSGVPGSCTGGFGHLPDILTQSKTWISLPSGETMLFHLASEVNMVAIHPRGIYRFWVTYWPLKLTDIEAKKLAAAKIDYPKQKLESVPLDYEVH